MRTFLGAALLAATALLGADFVSPVCRSAIATPPTVKLIVPDSPVPYGDMIIVQAVVDTSSISPDLAEYKHQWVVFDGTGKQKPIMVWPDGTRVVFAAGMQGNQYTIILDTDCLFVHKEGEAIQKAWMEQVAPLVATLTVGGGPVPVPPIPPTPTPPAPDPAPVLPDGEFGLAKFVYFNLKSDTSMSPADKSLVAAALSKSFDEVASQIVALSTVQNDIEGSILPMIKKRNNEALVSTGVPMASTAVFKKILGDKVYELYTQKPKKLNTGYDFAVAFREIAAGLRQYR